MNIEMLINPTNEELPHEIFSDEAPIAWLMEV